MSSQDDIDDLPFADWLAQRAIQRDFDVNAGSGGRSKLAHAAGISPSQVGRALDKNTKPSPDTLRALAKPLGVTVIEMYIRADVLRGEDIAALFRQDPDADYSRYTAQDIAERLPRSPEGGLDALADQLKATPEERAMLTTMVRVALDTMRSHA